ncbi:S-adenosyl-L-methionine-dependent methyltransferase [Penicillium daleae]|uniref:S-adenosyl-L-methionine-dependent methyltransferase n=1 Tax=Penicillium daleae TaxID=63821 RepID=A0AAD6G5L4_9EURO|nr:S-adenosyl-L-methionine-dependent methyltransferase [Penicillium daleae]KAJ5460206.1 S-adenosyl-L-methionine-dependent methyltransferase [Penicillium daleae]
MTVEEQKPFVMRDDEMGRLDGLHTLCMMMGNDQLHWAPLSAPRRVLDLGCGKWMQDFARLNPETKITGLDLEPSISGPNIETVIGDLEKPWPVQPGFDYIHTRWLIGCLSDWKKFFKQCYDNLDSGGWFEILDIGFPCQSADGTLKGDSHLEKWNNLLIEAANLSGRSLTAAKDFGRILEEVGFSNVSVERSRLPMNPWAKNPNERAMGEIALPIHKACYERLGHDFFCTNLKMAPKDVDADLPFVWKEMEDTEIHAWWPIYVVYGQKL